MSTEAQVRATAKWRSNHYRRIAFDVSKEFFSDALQPFAQERGYTMRGFILESIERNIKYIEENKGEK